MSRKNFIKKRIQIINNQEVLIKQAQNSQRKTKKLATKNNKEKYKLNSTPTIKKPKSTLEIDQRGARLQKRAVNPPNPNTVQTHAKFSNPYVKKTDTVVDLTIVISSFNRFDKVYRLLDQLYTSPCNYTFQIILLNDGSTDKRYETLPIQFPDLHYLRNGNNGGKKYYWRSITRLFSESTNYNAHCLLQLDDDYVLCDEFVNKMMDKFFELKKLNNSFVAMSFHRTTNFVPKQWGMDNWVDGGTLYDYRFIALIEFKIDKIPLSRWNNDPELSSGVWKQVSKKITKCGCLVYKTKKSLAYHDGNLDSKMNTKQRNRSPINTWDFKKNNNG